jgi:hypothetical protein
MVSASDVEQCFERYGWLAARIGDGRWQTTFQGDRAVLTIEVHLTADWLLFVMNLPRAGDPIRADNLLVANADMMLAKFAIDRQGRLILRADVPTEGFTYSHFADCLGALSHYADLYFDEWNPN